MNIRRLSAIILLFSAMGSLSAQSGTKILPEEFLRSWDPITLVFSEDRGPAGGGPADDPGDLFIIDKKIAGEYRWADSRTLQFLPADKWPPLSTISVVSGNTGFTLHTLMAPPVDFSPRNGSSNLNPVGRFSFTLPDWVDAERLASMIEVESRPLPGLAGQDVQRLDKNDFTVRVEDPNPANSQVHVVVELNELIGYGRNITFSIRLSEAADSGDAHVARFRVSTRPVFRLVQMGSGSWSLPVSTQGSLYSVDQAIAIRNQSVPLYLQFSEPLGQLSLEEVRRLVAFSPSIENFGYEVSGNRLYLHLNAQAETPYQLRIQHEAVLSSSGRVLAPIDETGFSFYFQQQQPYIRWNRGEAVVERYGPQYFPMEGRGVSRIDLRIYKIDPLDRQFWPFSSNALSVNEENRPPMPGESVYTQERAIRALGSPDISSIVTLPIDESSPSTSFGLDLSSQFAKISGEQAPGTYLVGYRQLGDDDTRHYVRIVVTDLNLSAVEEEHGVAFYVTSLKTGIPIQGATISIEGQANNSNEYTTVIRGTTDTQGRFHYEHDSKILATIRRISVSYGDDVISFDPSNPPPAFANNHWYGSSARWLSWLNRDPVETREEAKNRGYILTERPIYRPGETVHLLGYVRNRMTGQILPDSEAVERRVDIRGPGGKTWTYTIQLDDFGQFNFDFTEKDVPTGRYVANLYDVDRGSYLASVDFQIESYRVPRFEVQIQGEDEVPVDQPFNVLLSAEYYAGGLVAERPVFWRITESSFSRRPVSFPGFTFSSYENIGSNARTRASGITKQDSTDADGLATLTIDPSTRQSANAVRYVIEGTVEGADGQRVTAVKSVTALPPFSVGIRQDRFVRTGNNLTPKIVVLDFAGKPLQGIELGVRIYQRQWHSYLVESDFVSGEAEYRSDVVDELVVEDNIVSGGDVSELNYPMKESGVYIIEISARDNLGRLQTVHIDSYIPGTSPVAWERNEGSLFETTPDKDIYRPGDTARILLQSPFQEAAALAIVEKPTEVEYQWIQITGGQAVFEVKVEENMVPRLPVHFLLMRGRVPGTENNYTPSFDRGRPVSLANSTYLNVSPVYHKAIVDLDYPATSLPGTTVPVDIHLTNFAGTPLNGQVALWLVDRAVLSLAPEKPIQPLEAFIDPVTSAITLRDTRNEVVGNVPYRENPGGGGWEEAEAARLLDRTTVRKNFQTVPYFNATIPVTNGYARVNVELPDNLTDFAIRAVAVSGYSRFGVASGTISVRLPVIMQSALPRFVRPGDRITAGGIARIVEGPAGPARVQIATEGITLAPGEDSTRTVNLQQGISSPQYFKLVVPDTLEAPDVKVTLGVERVSDGKSDAFSLDLPVKDEVLPVHQIDIVQSEPGASFPFLTGSPDYRQGSLRQHLVISTEREVIQTLSGLSFMDGIPRQTTEQRVNGLRAAFKLNSLLTDFGWELDESVSQKQWEEFLDYLDTVRTAGGLYSQFPGGRGLVSLTSWVLDAMTLAEEADLATPSTTYERTIRSLQDALRSDFQYLITEYSLRERVEALRALTNADRFDESYAQSFLSAAGSSDLYAASLLVSIFENQGMANSNRVKTLVDQIWDRTTFRMEGNQRLFTGLNYQTRNWGGYLMNSDVRTVASVIRALSAADPRDQRIPPMIDYLLRQGDGRGWGNSIDTFEVLNTLDYVLSRRDRRNLPNIRFTLTFGDQSERIATKNTSVTTAVSDSQIPGEVAQGSGGREEPWLYLESSYKPDFMASQIPSSNDGFVVNRELQLFVDDKLTDRLVPGEDQLVLTQKDLVEVHVTVTNPTDRYYVAIHVPLAAGMEPLNPQLDTSGAEATPLGRMTRQPTYVRYLDDSVIYYYEMLPRGTFHFYFRERATFGGDYQLPPAWVESIYDPDARGNSQGAVLKINEE